MLTRYAPTSSIGARKTPPFRAPLVKPAIPLPETSSWYWNPGRAGIRFAPEWFLSQVRAFDPDITITWDICQERWLVWMRNPKLHIPLCSGWTLLFPVRYPDGSYMPLDERIFARLYAASVRRWGNGKRYFDAVEREYERDREQAERSRNDDVKYSAGEYFDYMAIKNIGAGNKFSKHFS